LNSQAIYLLMCQQTWIRISGSQYYINNQIRPLISSQIRLKQDISILPIITNIIQFKNITVQYCR